MATEVKLPRLGQGMEAGTIVKWLKSEGDRVEKGEPLYELDTEKVTQEVEAEASGVLLKILVSEGEVDVGKPIGVIGEEGEQVEEPEATDAAASADEAEKKEAASAGAGPGGARPAEAVSGEVETVKLTNVRRTIARRLSEAWQAPHFQIGMSADMTSAVHLRERLVEHAGESGVRPTYSDILT